MKKKIFQHKTKPISFIDFNLKTQSMLNMNPLTQEMKLFPGRYLFGIVCQFHILPKLFSFKIATISNHSLVKQLKYN